MRTSVCLSLITVSLLPLAGCIYVGDWGNSEAYREDFHSTHPITAGGTVSVEGFNGPIELIGGEQSSVEVSGTKSASSKSALDALRIDISSSPGSVRIRAIRPSDFQWHSGVRFSIRVPHKVVLDRITTSNGKITIEDVDGNANVQTSNGAIRVSRLKGELQAKTSNGSIDAVDLDGNANLHTSNGAIHADASHGTFESTTSNGSITARLTDPASTWPVRVESSNGHVELTLDTKQVPEVRAHTSNSSILVRLPAGANARVRATTSHSSVTSDFDELRSEEYDRKRKHNDLGGTLGRGGSLVQLESSNGSIKIMKL